MSPSAPPVRSSAASRSAYDSTTHWTSRSVACRDVWIAGSATFTTVPSMNAMLEPRIAAARTHEPLPAPGRWEGPARIAASSHGDLVMLATLYTCIAWLDVRGALHEPTKGP